MRATHAKHRDTPTLRNTAAQSLNPSTAPRTRSSARSPPALSPTAGAAAKLCCAAHCCSLPPAPWLRPPLGSALQ